MSQNTPEVKDNPTTMGSLNKTPDSVVTQNLPLKPLRTIIFKQLDMGFKRNFDSIYFDGMRNGTIVPMTAADVPASTGFDSGHYWVELYDDDKIYNTTTLTNSYGWYPFIDTKGTGRNDCVNDARKEDGSCIEPVRPGVIAGVMGVPGRLNRGDIFDPQASRNGINWDVDNAFYPISTIGQDEEAVKECIKNFASSYRSDWAYPAVGIPNRNHCQTFQQKMMQHCNLVPSGKRVTHE